MRHMRRSTHPGMLGLLFLASLLCACSSAGTQSSNGGSTGAPRSSPTAAAPSSPACATQASAKAEAWVSNQQVSGSINGGPETVLSTFVYPLGLPNEGQFGDDFLNFIAWAPDARHLAVTVGVNVGPAVSLFPYLVDTTTHAVTRIVLPGSGLYVKGPNRLLAWADNHTLLIFGGFSGGTNGSGGTVTYRYDITQNSLTPLPGVTAAAEGVARCSTLFYLELTPLTKIGGGVAYKGSALLHRYDLTTYSENGSPFTLGDTSTFPGAEGEVSRIGWDASPDGTQIAYQQTTVSLSGSSQLTITSKFFAAHADGSGATQILTGAIADSTTDLAISPNGQLVAVTNAEPSPTVLSGSMSGGAAHFYQPDAEGAPVWLADSSGFEAGLVAGSGLGIERWVLNTGGGKAPGTPVHQNSSNPATLP